MTTIKAQTSPHSEARYFREHLTRDDYYSEQQQTLGRWYGQACDRLGIDREAPVGEREFVALCKGVHPGDGSRLTLRRSPNRRCLYDMTISAPKSVSIMALVAGDERIIGAHDQAVLATLEAAEKLAQTRVRKGAAVDTKENRQTGNIIAARFTHRESRALDPQLHTHCTVFNLTYDGTEQRFKALEARKFYDRAKELTEIYREHLGRSLQALGYRTYRDRSGCIQISGVSSELMKRFSKRSAQRDRLVAANEQELGRALTNDETARLVHQNRAKKQKQIDPEMLSRMHLAQLNPEERLKLQQLKEEALVSSTRAVVGTAAKVDWIGTVRLAVLAVRVAGAVRIDPYLFSPSFSVAARVCFAARFVVQAQRTAAILRHAQRGSHRGISR